MSLGTLKKLDKRAHDAIALAQDELADLYPIGKEIRARLQSNHVTPSRCTVIGHDILKVGRIKVRTDGGHETTVHYTSVVP